jgi:hypothetical protein
MKKQIKPYTVIDWEDFQLIKFWGNYYIEEETQIMKLKKLTSTDLLIIFYIKGFGQQGYYGSQRAIAELLGITPEQVNRSMKILLKTINSFNKEPLFIKDETKIYYNKKFLYHKNGEKLKYLDFMREKYKRRKKEEPEEELNY